MSTAPLSLLATDTVRRRFPLASTLRADRGADSRRRGSVSSRLPGRGFRRAEQGPAGPVLLEVRPFEGGVDFQVWGPPDTPARAVAQGLDDVRRWAGLYDDLSGFAELADAHPVVRGLRRVLPTPALGAIPRVSESFGRAVLGQLVQGVEAMRSTAQLVALLGTPAPLDLWAWPTRKALGSSPAHQLRRCGIPLRSAVAIQRFAVDEAHFQRLGAARAWHAMDAALTSMPGIGGWTSAETRLWLGDPDAVSVGDYHIPALIGWALGDRSEDDATMLELLRPFAGHRGRVIRLVEQAAGRGLVATRPRRGPRAALSAHRYW